MYFLITAYLVRRASLPLKPGSSYLERQLIHDKTPLRSLSSGSSGHCCKTSYILSTLCTMSVACDLVVSGWTSLSFLGSLAYYCILFAAGLILTLFVIQLFLTGWKVN